VSGQSVVIAGAGTGFDNGAAIITKIDDNNFDYAVTVAPSTAGGGGTLLKVGDPAGNQRTIAASPTGIVINLPASGTAPFNASVTVTATANLPNTIVVGSSVTISGTSPADYNGTWTVTGLGNACTGGGANQRKFCFNIPTTPGATATAGATVATTGASFNVSSLTRTVACTAPVTPASTVTATTAVAHSFVVGQAVTISGTQGANEALYTGSQTILAVPTTTTFTYSITTVPACSDNTAGMTASALGVSRDTLINWVRGEDSRGDEASPGSGITIRPSAHGDVLHSRPAVVDYGGTTGVVVFYGSNDGVFRAINGNQGDLTDATVGVIGSVPPGGELWGFIPTEFYSNLKRMYLNSPVVKLSSTSSAILPAPQAKNYFFDGGTGVFQDITNGKVYLFLSARRGGRLIYALDVSDPTNPKFLWKRSNTDSGYSELGQTWSQPKVALVKGYVDGGGNAKPVLIFGAGYDTGEDAEPPTAATMGRGIFIVDALTGDVVWQAGPGGTANDCVGTPCLLADMTYAIPSDVTLLDREIADLSGFVDRLYVPDLGGNVWRVDLEPATGNTPDKWQVSKFASVGGTGTTKRKLFFPPDVVTTKNFDAVLFSTGDREHPTLDHQSVNIINRFYMLKDTTVSSDACPVDPVTTLRTCQATIVDNTSSTADDPPAGLFNASFGLPSSASSEPTTPGPAYDQSGNGFYITLRNAVATKNADGTTTYGPSIETGEKAVNAPTTVGGFTFFGTNTPIPPDPSVCQPNLGTARGYRINFITGEAQFVVFAGGGLPPSPVAGVVNVDGVDVPFLIGGGNPDGSGSPDDTSSVGGQEPPIPITPVRSRVFWYRDLGNR
jgi:type IV pilus assembly protein PilY1